MRIRVEIEHNELKGFMEKTVLAWWESQEGCASPPTNEDIIDYIEEHLLVDITNTMSIVARAHELYEDVSMTICGKSIDEVSIIQDLDLRKIINRVWMELTDDPKEVKDA